MQDSTTIITDEEKEKRRKKQYKRLGKILSHVWELDDKTNYFQEYTSSELLVRDYDNDNDTVVLCLTDIGQKIDSLKYKVGRHGWIDFAKDLGGVYNLHINSTRRSKTAPIAKKHLDVVKDLLGSIDKSLSKIATDYIPKEPSVKNGEEKSIKKRKSDSNNNDNDIAINKKKKQLSNNKNSDLAERENRAMEQLCLFIEEQGGNRNIVNGFRSRVTKNKSLNTKFDIVYFNENNRRFRSMLEVGRFLKLVIKTSKGNGDADNGRSNTNIKRRIGFRKTNNNNNNNTKEYDNEKKRLRKELEKLRKAHNKATKNLDDYVIGQDETQYPIDDRIIFFDNIIVDNITTDETKINLDNLNSKIISQQSSLVKVTKVTCAAACIPDIVGFPSIPEYCTPDVLMTWDFLCTFERALSLSPINLDDFANALKYIPPDGQIGDDLLVPPIYLAEVHLSLLKLLLQDRSSDDWWWSTLESNEIEQINDIEFDESDDIEKSNNDKPVIKIDIASLLGEVEDPLITNSWMRSLENIRQSDNKDGKELRTGIKTAMRVVSNKWVAAYLRKTLDLYKSQGMKIAKRALCWLLDTVLDARPDLGDRAVHIDTVYKARAKVVENITKIMETLTDTVPAITDEDAISDFEGEDDSDDESDDEDNVDLLNKKGNIENQDESQKPASSIPPKPYPSLVDLLLPPAKPTHNSEFVDAFTWSHVVGATASRYLHRKKRLLNEIDDRLRETNLLCPLVASERRERENQVASRVLTECCGVGDVPSLLEKALEHLCNGGNYLDLSPIDRLCILRILIEAAYDTGRIYEVVSGNYKQRTNAMKSLELEQRRAKKEAKDKVAADETAAREQLAAEVRERFLDEKREEIRKLNKKSKEFSDDIIESLTEEDIIDFDEDIRADYDALPAPESFNKSEVHKMIRKMQEQAAFDTDVLRVLTMDELIHREMVELEEMEGQLSGFGGDDAIQDSSLDRETLRSIERLQRDIEKAKIQAEKLPPLREKALEQLTDAIENGTIKVLRTAFTAAKKAKLCGVDDETGGMWAVNLMRDAAIELENAKQNKRLLDAQKDLVAKLNKCFIRTEPVGRDRFGNRFWNFDNDESGHTWVEAEYTIKETLNGSTAKEIPGFSELSRHYGDIAVGTKDMEEDILGNDELAGQDSFIQFSRLEYHTSGTLPSLVQNRWGCHATEDSIRAVIKNLDSRGIREKGLKDHMKESLENIIGYSEKSEQIVDDEDHAIEQDDVETKDVLRYIGDDEVFKHVKDVYDSKSDIVADVLETRTSGIGALVRVRKVLEETKNPQTARYENGTVTGWKINYEKVDAIIDDQDDSHVEQETVEHPLWKVQTERGHVAWLDGAELLESITRHEKWVQGRGYFEHDASFFAYHNSLGRYLGKVSDAPYASSPFVFAKLMLKREAEIYPKLKVRSYDNSWGGQSGSRALWTNSMKDYAYDFQTVRQGLLTLENAFFELTGQFSEYSDVNHDDSIDGTAILNDVASRFEVELESMEKGLAGLWNSPKARSIFLAIVKDCKTTGILALSLDLLVRNTTKYLVTHKLLTARGSRAGTETIMSSNTNVVARPVRSTRRLNAWQQQQKHGEYDDSDEDWS